MSVIPLFIINNLTKFKFPKIKLYQQILIGFVLGIIFGAVFKVDHHRLDITSGSENVPVKDWAEVSYIKKDSVLKSFDINSQIAIVKFYEGLAKQDAQLKDIKLKIKYPGGKEQAYENLKGVSRPSSIGSAIKPVGEVFIRLLNMIAVPLVLASLIVGAASLSNLRHLAKIGGKLLALYAMTAVLSVSMGQVLAVIVQPGNTISPETKIRLVETYRDEVTAPLQQNYSFSMIDFLVDIVPKNPFKSLAESDFLQIVFFAILTGLILCVIPENKARPVINFFDGFSDAMIKLVEKVILFAPLAIFALISATVSEFGFDIIKTLFWYSLTAITGLIIITFGIYPAVLKIFSKADAVDFFKAQKEVLAVGFTTSSSSATLPVTIDVCENRLGIPNRIASFILPIGTTINKDGTAMFQAVAAIFIAQVYGFELSFTQQLTIFITCVITGAATAPVAGAGIIMLVVVLKAVGLPVEGIALIIGVDRLINMCRVVPNVVGDTLACVVIADSEGELGEFKTD
jgi:proton glutamate symport protein